MSRAGHPIRNRTIVAMRLDGAKLVEIAHSLETTKATVSSVLQRAGMAKTQTNPRRGRVQESHHG